jgi:hypothetical protein
MKQLNVYPKWEGCQLADLSRLFFPFFSADQKMLTSMTNQTAPLE